MATSTESPYFSTSVSRVAPGEVGIRGYDLRDIIKKATFSEAIFLTLRGRRPTSPELAVFDAIMCSCIDHGFVNALAVTARYAMSGSGFLPAGVAAGILAAGKHTAMPQRVAAMLLELGADDPEAVSDAAVVERVKSIAAAGERVPGLGHPLHRAIDPRSVAVREVATSVGADQRYLALLERVQAAVESTSNRRLVLNVDGMMASLLTAMGFEPDEMLAVNILAAAPGIAAQTIEEGLHGVPLRIVRDYDVEYQLPATPKTWS